MTIHRRDLIKDLLLLVPVRYAHLPTFLEPSLSPTQPEFINSSGIHYAYPYLIAPREYPDDERRYVKPPDWNTFDNKTNFITLRGFQIKDNKIVHYENDLDIYSKIYKLGNIIWPNRRFLDADNVPELVAAFKKRNLFLFDIWGYVPGSGPGTWTQFKLSPDISRLFSFQLGDHWLGMDNGEQDGRYIGGHASQMYPSAAERKYQYLNFQQHFEKLTNDLGNKMATLVSLSFGHYFLKQGLYTMIGAETAQALPNAQIFYSFIRGAGKQYGVPWFGNVSVYNRWGYKSFDSIGPDHGPTQGTSLSLMRRLMYSQILYNAVAVGFEAGWFYTKRLKQFSGTNPDEKTLTPIGHIQRNAVKWVQRNGQPGVMHTPVALMLDFYAGWTFPRHLYADDIYRVWGNLPYKPGDYWTDALLSMIYPGYQNSSYFHDESGFSCPTPYGDIADCLLSDVESWILGQYPVLVIASELSGGVEIHNKLMKYIKEGGHLIITAGNLVKFTEGIGDIKVNGQRKSFKAGQIIYYGNKQIVENVPFEFYPLSFPQEAEVIGTSDNDSLIVSTTNGKGRLTILSSTFGISDQNIIPENAELRSQIDKPLPRPFPILEHVKTFLSDIFHSLQLFGVNESLGLITCCKSKEEYLLGITNNSWQEQPINLISHCGKIISTNELLINQSAKEAIGYIPENVDKTQIGNSGENTIAGGDIRIFSVKVTESNVSIIPRMQPQIPSKDRYLPLRNITSIKEEILLRPTFFQHFTGVVIDWKYLNMKETNILKKESGWISRQGLEIIVDLTSGVDFYPELRLIDNLHEDYMNSMAKIRDVLNKMPVFHVSELILPLHRFPENNFTEQQTWDSFKESFKSICSYAQPLGINLNLRLCLERPPHNVTEALEFIKEVDAENLKVAPETSYLLADKIELEKDILLLKNKTGLWLVSGLLRDIEGKYWNQNEKISDSNERISILKIIKNIPQVPVILDGIYRNQDEEYLDVKALGGSDL